MPGIIPGGGIRGGGMPGTNGPGGGIPGVLQQHNNSLRQN